MPRMSIATAASDDGNPNVKLEEYVERKQRRSIAESRKAEIIKAVPIDILGEAGDESSQGGNTDVQPEFLLGTDQFFITKGGADYLELFGINVPHLYSLLDSSGERVFFVAETKEAYAAAYSPHRVFDFNILRRRGGLFFEIIGDTRSATVLRNGEPMGTIRKAAFRRIYYVRNRDHPLFTITQNGDTQIDYEICATGFSEPIGIIKQKWPRKNDPQLQIMYGMSLPQYLSEDSKMLLISAFIILYFYHLQPVSRGSNRKNFWFGFAFSTGVAIILSIMITVVILSVTVLRKIDKK